MKDEGPFAMAGIWESWKDAEGRPLHTFSIITTDANSMMKEIHHRMPVILQASDEKKWLNSKDTNEVISMLKPFPSEQMKAYPVSKLVNSAASNTAEIHLQINR